MTLSHLCYMRAGRDGPKISISMSGGDERTQQRSGVWSSCRVPCEPPAPDKGKSCAQLALASVEIPYLNNLYMASFKRQYDQNDIDVDLYKQQLRIWQHVSRTDQTTDLSQGLVVDLHKLFGVDVDAEGKDASYVDNDEYLKELQLQIAGSESFKMLNGKWLLRVVMFVEHREVVVWNVLGEQAFVNNQDDSTYVDTYNMRGIHNLASFFSPDDRVLYYDALVAQYSATAKPFVAMAKLCKQDGSIALYILRSQRMAFPEFPNRPIFVLTFEPAPESRYLTVRTHQATGDSHADT